MKNLKVLLIIFTSLLSTNGIFACGGGWYEASYYNIYQIDLMLAEGTLGETYHNNREDFVGNAVEDNLNEWSTYFEGKYSMDQISDWIYTEEISADVSKINKDLSAFNSTKREAFIEYITIAKKAESVSNRYDYWNYDRDDEPAENLGFINKLGKDIQSKQRMTTNKFLLERYTFQLIKLYYYSERYEKAISTYDSFYENRNSSSIMEYWALDYKAGAQMQSGNTIQANYNFLQVFSNYPGRRSKSYYSMMFSNEEQFSKTLDICQTNEDKAAFHFVRGVNKNSVVLEDLKASFSYAPNNEYAKVLMANELVKMEHLFWNKDIEYADWNDVEEMPREQLLNYVEDFIVFTEKAVSESEDKVFWNISLAYLNSLSGNYKQSEDILKSVSTSNVNYNTQKQGIGLLNYIHLNTDLTKNEENELGQIWFDYNKGNAMLDKNNWSDYGSINAYLANHLENYYTDIDPVKSFLFSGQTLEDFTVEYEEKLDAQNIHDLRMGLLKADKTDLQKYGEKCFLGETNSPNINESLMEVEATLLMRDPETLAEALAYFEQLTETRALETNPFNMEIRDCIWGEGWSDENICNHKPGMYTKASLAKKLVEMKRLAEKKKSAMDYYLLGNAYYNMSYFGHAYKALSYFRSGSSYTGFNDCSAALEMYEKAIPLFKDNKEMQAKAIFMAAKCEQNLYFIDLDNTSEYGYWGIDYDYKNPKQSIIDYNTEISEAGYREYFELLAKDYKDTQFYQEAIDECSYFDLYVHY